MSLRSSRSLVLAASGDDRVGGAVQEAERELHHPSRLVAPDLGDLSELRDRGRGEAGEAADGPAHRVLGRAGRGLPLDPEDPGHDHVERDRLHPRGERERLADGPALDLALGDVDDHLRVLVDRLAVERRQQQLALAHVARPERREDRVRPDDRAQRRLGGQ